MRPIACDRGPLLSHGWTSWLASWRWVRRHDERAYSFVDATSFQVMREKRLRAALAFDGDCTAAGFVEVRA